MLQLQPVLEGRGTRHHLAPPQWVEGAYQFDLIDNARMTLVVPACPPYCAGAKTLVVRAGAGEASAVLEVWGRGRLLQELHVPKGLHGALYNDGWFGAGAAWSPDESKLAYVAEVCREGASGLCTRQKPLVQFGPKPWAPVAYPNRDGVKEGQR